MQKLLGISLVAVLALPGCFRKPPVASSVRATRPDGSSRPVRAASPGAYEHYLAGTLAYDEGRYGDALREFVEALAYDSGDPYLNTRVAELFWRAGELEQAEELCHGALRADPDLPEANLLWARLAEIKGKTEEASTYYQRAISLDPQAEEAYLEYGSFLLAQNQPAAAEALYAQLSARRPEAIEGYLSLAEDALHKGEEPRAARFYSEVFRRAPYYIDAAVALGGILERAGQRGQAIDIYRQALEAAGDDQRLLFPLIALLLAEGHPEEAEAYSDRAMRLAQDTGSPDLYRELGRLYLDWKLPRGAILPLTEAIVLSPQDGSPRYLLGLAYSELGELPRAIEELERASRLAPSRPEISFQLGVAYAASGQREKAREAYLRALSQKPAEPIKSAIEEGLKTVSSRQ
jgi:Tfp pilus assembly protein PilF